MSEKTVCYTVRRDKMRKKPICYMVAPKDFAFALRCFYVSNRNSAIMWLKRYGKENETYIISAVYEMKFWPDRFPGGAGILREVFVSNGHVYDGNGDILGACIEPHRMCVYGKRNN
jgi:hypothetical protein